MKLQIQTRLNKYGENRRAYFLVVFCFFSAVLSAQQAGPLRYVDPYIGTAGGGTEYGGMMPLVTAPFGAMNWTTQTRINKVGRASYAYEDSTVSGFIGTRQPAIWMGDYGYVTLMPEQGAARFRPEDRALGYRHEEESVSPDYTKVVLHRGEGGTIRVEMTATETCGFLRFTYPSPNAAKVFVEATRPGVHGLIERSSSPYEVRGYNPDRMDARLGPFALSNFKGYFVIRFSRPISSSEFASGYHPLQDRLRAEGDGVSAAFGLDMGGNTVLEARVGTSLISMQQAEQNLEKELPASASFDQVRENLSSRWQTLLSRFNVSGGTDEEKRIFYTGLFHALLYPRDITEHGNYYSAFDDQVHPGAAYTDYSLWDTYRAEASLLTLLVPERIDGMVRALLQDYREGGWMPKWPNPSYTNIMIATHADSFVAEAIMKGFHGFDQKLAYEAMHKDAFTPPDDDLKHRWADREPHTPYEARGGLTYSLELGYVPADKTAEAASSTLEDAYDDSAIALVARRMGKTEDYRILHSRSFAYRKLYNHETGFMQARNADGSWAAPNVGWTEGDTWAYTWAVQQDPQGLVDLMGGEDAFNSKLDEYFAGGHHHHDNEPAHHYPYLYNFSGQPWKTQELTRRILDREYSDQPNGLDGNEDCGQMSAWYIFSALGFYPFNPSTGDYVLTSPVFTRSSLHFADGNKFTVEAPDASSKNRYIQSVSLNGKPLKSPVVSYREIRAGGILHFVLGPTPSSWAAEWRAVRLDKEDTHQEVP